MPKNCILVVLFSFPKESKMDQRKVWFGLLKFFKSKDLCSMISTYFQQTRLNLVCLIFVLALSLCFRPNFHFSSHVSGICRFPFPPSAIVPYVKESVPRLCPQASLRASTSFSKNSVGKESSSVLVSSIEPIPKIDKSGRFCSPRAARELAL